MRWLQPFVLVLLLAVDASADDTPKLPVQPFRSPEAGSVMAAAISTDGKWVLTADYCGTVVLWRADREKPVWAIHDVNDRKNWYAARSVGFAADGKRVFCAWSTGVTEIDRETGKVLRTTNFPADVKQSSTPPTDPPPPDGAKGLWIPLPTRTEGNALVFLPGTDECVFHGDDDRLVRFNFATGKRHPKFDLLLAKVGTLDVVLSSDGKRVLTHNATRYIAEWDLETGERCRLFGALPDKVEGQAGYFSNGDRVWFGPHGLLLLDRKTGKSTEAPAALAKYKGALWFSPDGTRALGQPGGYLAGGTGGEVKEDRVEVLDVEDGKVLRAFSTEGLWYKASPNATLANPVVRAYTGMAFFSRDGKLVLLTQKQPAMGLWDVTTGKRIQQFGR